MTERARLIIPLWGAVYAKKLVTMTLPALLAPGNLPALSDLFDVEVVIVTERGLFELIQNAKSYQLVSDLCETRLVALDDLMTEVPGDYGVVLTHALYRGFADLGERMTETFLIFLNADFIVSDGSFRHLALLMQRGERVIHAPSFRVVLEDVWPKLEETIDHSTGSLNMSPREMVKLALAHKHITVKARTVNQRLCHQWRMDQFYWYVDDDTLIGYQWPVALVAIKPEKATLEPSLVWDYGFVPDAAPTARRYFIEDSDDFFMIEPQKRTSGDDLVRVGWISVDAIAADLSKWTTKEQRDCGRQLLKIHSADLPEIQSFVRESENYMAQIYQRLTPLALDHRDHALLGRWFLEAKGRMRGVSALTSGRAADPETVTATPPKPPRQMPLPLKVFRAAYKAVFGQVPVVGKFHPLWADLHVVSDSIARWKTQRSAKVLWLCSSESLFHSQLSGRMDPAALSLPDGPNKLETVEFDNCFCELTIEEFTQFRNLYARIRPLVKDGGEVMVFVFNRHLRSFQPSDIALCESAFPDIDQSIIHFNGSVLGKWLRNLFLWAANAFPLDPWKQQVAASLVLVPFAPVVRLANALAAVRDDTIMPHALTSFSLTFKVQKRKALQRLAIPIGASSSK